MNTPPESSTDSPDDEVRGAAEPRRSGDGRGAKRAAMPRQLATSILFTMAAAVGAGSQTGIVSSVHVASVNMVPTLELDDHVVVRGIGSPPALGDVVAYRTPFDNEHLQLGRIVAVAGDRIEMTSDGLEANGQSVAIAASDVVAADGDRAAAQASSTATAGEDDFCRDDTCLVGAEAVGAHRYFTRRAGGLAALLFPRRIVPEDHVFVLSDNRADERDSRIYGAIPRTAIVGVASFVYYASDQTGIRWDRMNRRVS